MLSSLKHFKKRIEFSRNFEIELMKFNKHTQVLSHGGSK